MYALNFKKTESECRALAEQRKEENAVFCSQYLKELGDKQHEIQEDSDCEGPVEPEFTRKEYRFSKFDGNTFGRKKAANEDEFARAEGIRFEYCDFAGCGFSNIVFKNCLFIGCKFTECFSLGHGTVFESCSFNRRTPGKNSIDDMPSTFESCELTIRLTGCDMSGIVATKSHFYYSTFSGIDMNDAIFVDCVFDIARISDCDMRNTKIVGAKFNDFSIEDSSAYTRVNEKTFLGRAVFNAKERMEAVSTSEAYRLFSKLFENCNIPDMSGEYFYLSKKAEINLLGGFTRIKAILGYITCGFGERPSFSLLSSLAVVLVCGFLYMMLGVNVGNEFKSFIPLIGMPMPPFADVVNWFHFSLVTFTTVGYGNVVPVGGSIIVSGVEMVLGVIMVGTWVSTLVRKMTR
mgnify:CR=1 FL=1